MSLKFIIQHLEFIKRTQAFKELTAEPELLLEIVMRQTTVNDPLGSPSESSASGGQRKKGGSKTRTHVRHVVGDGGG